MEEGLTNANFRRDIFFFFFDNSRVEGSDTTECGCIRLQLPLGEKERGEREKGKEEEGDEERGEKHIALFSPISSSSFTLNTSALFTALHSATAPPLSALSVLPGAISTTLILLLLSLSLSIFPPPHFLFAWQNCLFLISLFLL